MPLSETFLAERLLASGTCRLVAVGKWDLGLITPKHVPKHCGFGDPEFQLPDQQNS